MNNAGQSDWKIDYSLSSQKEKRRGKPPPNFSYADLLDWIGGTPSRSKLPFVPERLVENDQVRYHVALALHEGFSPSADVVVNAQKICQIR